AIVVIEEAVRPRESERRAVRAPDTGDSERLVGILVLAPLNIIADEQIEAAIVVDIDECRTCGPRSVATNAGACGDILEFPVAEIAVEMIAPERSDENIHESIVVIVPHRDAHAVVAHIKPGTCGDIRKSAVAIV